MPDRTVIIVQRDRRRVTFATQVLKSPRGYRYPLFGSTDRYEASQIATQEPCQRPDIMGLHRLLVHPARCFRVHWGSIQPCLYLFALN